MKSINLFTGIGGMIIPGERPVVYVEKDRFARRVLRWRMNDLSIPRAPICPDVTTFSPKKRGLRAHIVVGGFPCQSISACGNRGGLVKDSSLFFEMVRIAREARARWIFIENVYNLLSCGMRRVLKKLASEGYSARWIVNAAQNFRLPHKRKRVFLLARRCRPFSLRLPQTSMPQAGYTEPPSGKRSCGRLVEEKTCSLPLYTLKRPLLLRQGSKSLHKNLFPTPRRGGGNFALRKMTDRSTQDLASVLKYSEEDPAKRRKWKDKHVHFSFTEWLMGFPAGWTQKTLRYARSPKKLCRGSPINTRRQELLGNACCPKQCSWAFLYLRRLFPK